MKKKLFNSYLANFLLIFAVSTSCVTSQSFITVKGSGMSIDKNIPVSGFHSIDVSGGFDVVLVQGNSEDLILTAQENLFDYIKVEVNQGKLKIYTDRNIWTTKQMKVRISFKSIDNLEISGGGDVVCEASLNVPGLGISISGGGDITTTINTGELNCKISGGGDAQINGDINSFNLHLTGGGDIRSEINALNIDCDISGGGDISLKGKEKSAHANFVVSGGGDVDVETFAEKLTCSISGGGDATLRGQATDFEITINGGGDVQAGELVTSIANIHCSGGSDIHVNVGKELTGQVSGGGDVYYTGSPAIVSVDARGGSEVHKQ